ncbi:MAG: hypothetical protein AAFY45_20245, partial [Bacteroidota bacterium]
MPARFKPHIFLACTLASEEGKRRLDPAHHCDDILRVLQYWIDNGGCEVLQARPGSKLYLEDVLANKNNRREVVGIHLIGELQDEGHLLFRSRSDQKSYSFEEFGNSLKEFPKIQFLFLSGINDPKLIHTIHAAGVPAVFSIKDARFSPTIVEAFYLQMLRGKSVKDSVLGLDSILKIEISRHEVDFSYQYGPWNGNDLPNPGAYGFYYRKDKFKNLGWRLRSPLLIPGAEKDEIDSYLVKLSNEDPIARLKLEIEKEDAASSNWTEQERAIDAQDHVIAETLDTIEELTEIEVDAPPINEIGKEVVSEEDTVEKAVEEVVSEEEIETEVVVEEETTEEAIEETVSEEEPEAEVVVEEETTEEAIEETVSEEEPEAE